MNKRWLVIVLFISLAFNLAVMIMFSYTAIYHRPPFCPPEMRHRQDNERRKDRDANLKPELKQQLAADKVEMRKFREDFNQKRKAFMQTLITDTLDVKASEAAMVASLQSHEELERHLGSSLIRLRQNMTGKEAQTFFKERFERRNNMKDRFRHKRDSLHNRFDQKRR